MRNELSLAVIMSLLLTLLSIELHAQILINGNNLDIGTNNSLTINEIEQYYGNAIGLQNVARSYYTLAVGSNDTINTNSLSAVTLGISNYVQGEAALGFGRSVKVFGDGNIGIGHHIRVNGLTGGMVIGGGIIGTGNSPDAYLVNDSSNSLAVGFNSTRPTLFLTPSPNNYGQGILDRTGRVAIGDVMPQAKLHIRSDEGEDAGIILTPGAPTEDSTYIQLRDAQHGVSVNSQGQMFIAAGIYNQLYVTSENFKVDRNFVGLGLSGNQPFTICTDYTPSIGLNARQSNGQYLRGYHGSSYVLEFGNTAWKLRTARYVDPRDTAINNWVDAVTVKIDGAITLNGKVGVNTENTTQDYALAVDGGVVTTKVHIQEVGDWQDRVFGEDYPLMPLGEVEAFVAANGHLPGIPSEAEVKADGYDVAAMHAMLLGKIEELTLYTLQQQKELDSLRTLVTVRFGYDACGNRTSRTLEFAKGNSPDGDTDDDATDGGTRWQASLIDGFAGGEAMLFPNPTEGGFILSLTGADVPQGTKATLCTVEGKVLEERTVAGSAEEFDLGGKPAGVYLLRLVSERETKVWKVVKRN